MNLKDAKKVVKENGLIIELENEEENNDKMEIKEQMPKPGILVNKGNKVYVK